MTLAGTRPPLISETNLYELHHYARLAIKPGITGLWQVSGRSDITDFEEVVRLDKEYIEKEKELEEWLRGLEGMDRFVDDYVGDKIPLWEKIMDRQGTVCCAWEKTAFEEGLKVGIRLMMEVYSL